MLYARHFAEEEEEREGRERSKKYSFMALAGLVWGVVMWLFYVKEGVLQESLASSMRDLYISTERPVRTWK